MAFVDVVREPDAVVVQVEGDRRQLQRSGGAWCESDLKVNTTPGDGSLRVSLAAPRTAVSYVQLRWRGELDAGTRFLGDAWERSYGELGWRSWDPHRAMPWYFVANEGGVTHGWGVRVQPRAMCFWQADPKGLSLWLDVRSGGVGVELGERQLQLAEVVCRQGRVGESAFAAQRELCRMMCPSPRLPREPVYGINDWYYAYGHNSEQSILDDTRRLVELSPGGENRPVSVIDDGWAPTSKVGGKQWDRGTAAFPSMPGVAAKVRELGARPGIWIRPLLAPDDLPDAWLLPAARWFKPDATRLLDPTRPEVIATVHSNIARLREWGFDLIKHDFSCYDVLGRWGFDMGAQLTNDKWAFADRSCTTAEVLLHLYHTIRDAAGDAIIIGCNTPSHLSAGLFELQRIGDDTSGRDWERTRRMGVNTLAFRAAQQGTFYGADADCVGLTDAVPWEFNRQWLDLVARSGTPLFVSADPKAVGPEQSKALREAFAIAAAPQPVGEPLDWRHTSCPAHWRLMGAERRYDWTPQGGVSPFFAW